MLVRTDDTDAFGQSELLRINLKIPEGQTVNKAVLYCGESVKLEFIEPADTIEINLSGQQTAVLQDNNCCTIELYDGENKKLTIPCIAEFKTREGVK